MVERVLPQSRSELLNDIENEWSRLMAAMEKLSPDELVKPDAGGWSPKDNLAHLAAWMRYMKDSYLHKMPAHEAWGMDEKQWKQLDENGINAVGMALLLAFMLYINVMDFVNPAIVTLPK